MHQMVHAIYVLRRVGKGCERYSSENKNKKQDKQNRKIVY